MQEKENKIVFVSPFENDGHVELEARLIESYFDIDRENYTFYFIGWEDHIHNVQKELRGKIDLKRIILERKWLLGILRWLFEIWKLRKIKKIHLAYDVTFEIKTFLLFLGWFDIIFLHGYWKELIYKKRRLFHKIFFKFLLTIKKTKIITLGEWFYEGIIEDNYLTNEQKENIFWIYHPILSFPKKQSKNKGIRFGLLWKQKNRYKNIRDDDVENFKKIIKKSKHKILSSWERFIDRRGYEKIINNSDYILNFSRWYKYRCSGVVSEALAKGIPIVWIKNEMLRYMENKNWNIWYLEDDINKISLKKIESDFYWVKEYRKQIKNIRKIGKELTNLANINKKIKYIYFK